MILDCPLSLVNQNLGSGASPRSTRVTLKVMPHLQSGNELSSDVSVTLKGNNVYDSAWNSIVGSHVCQIEFILLITFHLFTLVSLKLFSVYI